MAPRRSKRLETKKPPSSIENHSKSTSLDSNKNKAKKNNKRKSARKSASNKRKSLPQATNLSVVIDIEDEPINSVPHSRNRRPQVISLDVTDSESSSESDVEEISLPQPKRANNASLENGAKKSDFNSHKNIKNGRCSVSDSDEDFVPDFNPIERDETGDAPKSPNKSFTYGSGSDSDSDIYKVNFKEEREKAFGEAAKELQSMIEIKKKKGRENNSPALIDDSNLSENLDIWENDKNNPDASLCSSLEDSFNIANLSSVSISNGKRGRKSVVRTSRKTKMALKSLEAFSKKFDDMQKENEPDESLCDDIIMMEDSEVSIRICWGLTYTRHTLKNNAKLIGLYQELAEKNNASINEVLLSFKDDILSPETKPSDLKLSIADTLDGAIIRRKSSETNCSESTREEDGSLSFKIQTSNRKEVHTISINKYDKMSLLMEKYSNLRNIPLDKLRFRFDGESLESSDTPSSLDLEGGECIDVFEL